jgi:hypothetical protein
MPPEYRHWRSDVLCNDCEMRSVVAYHFLYHKCSHCGSYNTKLVRSFPVTGEAVEFEDAEGDEEVQLDVSALHPDDEEDEDMQNRSEEEIISSSSSE